MKLMEACLRKDKAVLTTAEILLGSCKPIYLRGRSDKVVLTTVENL